MFSLRGPLAGAPAPTTGVSLSSSASLLGVRQSPWGHGRPSEPSPSKSPSQGLALQALGLTATSTLSLWEAIAGEGCWGRGAHVSPTSL